MATYPESKFISSLITAPQAVTQGFFNREASVSLDMVIIGNAFSFFDMAIGLGPKYVTSVVESRPMYDRNESQSSFDVWGILTSQLLDGDLFDVTDNPDYNGTYTVDHIEVDIPGNYTTIFTVEEIGSGSVGGNLSLRLQAPFRSAYLNAVIQSEQPKHALLQPYIIGENRQEIDLAVLIQGEVLKEIDLSVAVSGEARHENPMDMMIWDPLPYRYMRIRKDLITRYFAGPASDGNFPEFFDPPNPSAINTSTGSGVFSETSYGLRYSSGNEAASPSSFSKYSLPLSSSLLMNKVGTRVVVDFRIDTFGENSCLLFGLMADQNNPSQSVLSGHVAAFAFETEQNHVEFRGWFGVSSTARNLGTAVPIDRFLGEELVLEMETILVGVINTIQYRLFEKNRSLERPFFSMSIDTTVQSTVDRFSVSTLGKRAPEYGDSDMSVIVSHVDIERGGSIYEIDPEIGIPISDAKWRPYMDRSPIELAREGENTIFVALSDDRITTTTETSESIILDSRDPVIYVVSFSAESTVMVPESVNPPIVKGSTNSAFDDVTMDVYATHAGTWSLRVDSTGVTDGTEIYSGEYPTAGETVTIAFNFSEFPQVDGNHDVTLYLIADTGKPTAKKLGEYILPFVGFVGDPVPFD